MLTIEEKAFRKAYMQEIKDTVTANGGSVTLSASLLGIPHRRLSRILNGRELGSWWTKYKKAKKAANKRARNERWAQRRERKVLGYED